MTATTLTVATAPIIITPLFNPACSDSELGRLKKDSVNKVVVTLGSGCFREGPALVNAVTSILYVVLG